MPKPRYSPSQTVGPFFHNGLRWRESNQLTPLKAGVPVTIFGIMTDGAGAPVADALMEFWSSQAEPGTNTLHRAHGFGRIATSSDGIFRLHASLPSEVVIAGHRHAPHFNVVIFARGLLTHLFTRVYIADSLESIAHDPVIAVIDDHARADTLLAKRDKNGAMVWNVKLQGEGETVFLARN